MATAEELRAAIDEIFSAGIRRGLLRNDVEDAELDGRHITVHGQRLTNFGPYSYLGLETDPRIKAAVREAVDRYGTQFSTLMGSQDLLVSTTRCTTPSTRRPPW